MKKKTILITGAGGNLGRIAVTRFEQEGWRVIASVSPGKSLSGFEQKDVHVYSMNLSNEPAVAGWLQTVFSEYSQLHAALLLAGGFKTGSIADTAAGDLREMMAVNFETAYHVARPVFMHMKNNQSGRIILIGAKPALEVQTAGNSLAYALSKAMLYKLTDYINAAGNSHHVAACCLVPDIIDTPDNRAAMPKADFSKWVQPEKMAELMLRLCNEESKLPESIIKLY